MRRYASPASVMRTSRVLPPELYCPGVKPGQAANCRPRQVHQLARSFVLARDGLDMRVVLRDALVEPVQLAQQIAAASAAPFLLRAPLMR